VHDGVPLNDVLLAAALGPATSDWGSAQFRFDQLCDSLPDGRVRAELLRPYVERTITPDSPYHGLVALLRAGFVDVVFTLNIDDLLEQAFAAAGMRERQDYAVVSVPELRVEAAVDMISSTRGPRIRIVKLHGGFESGFNLMSSREITSYDDRIADLVQEYSTRPTVVCGYSFFHLNVLRAFSRRGGPLFYVNPTFPSAPMVLSLMAERKSSSLPLFVDGAEGDFAVFMKILSDRLSL
jgi:hypothetical protein